MYGNSSSSSVATDCRRARESSSHRQAERLASSRSVVAGGALHGARLANSAQPPAGQGHCPDAAEANLAGLRVPCSRAPDEKGEPRQEERVAPLGVASRVGGQPLHPKEQAALVTATRPKGSVSTTNVMALLAYQDYRCALTGRELTPEMAALDHIVPIRRDGEHAIENTQVLHKDVNRAKGSLTSEEFIGMCREVVQWSTTGARE